MNSRKAYKEKYEAQLKEWGAKFEVLKAQAEKATAQAKIDFTSHVNSVQERFEAAKAKLNHLGKSTDATWHDVKKEADKAWHDIEHALEGALAAVKAHTTHESKKTD